MRTFASIVALASSLLLASVLAAQEYVPSFVVHPNQRIALDNLHMHTAISSKPSAALAAALETVFDNPDVCCGRKSTFSEIPELPGHLSLQDIRGRLNGKHVLGDGRPFAIAADYRPGSAITSSELVSLLTRQERMLVQWNGQVYVVSGVVFDDKVFNDGNHDYVLRKILMLDPSVKNGTHNVVFDREKDDWSKIDGFLVLRLSSS